jgi:hypothetical protein
MEAALQLLLLGSNNNNSFATAAFAVVPHPGRQHRILLM